MRGEGPWGGGGGGGGAVGCEGGCSVGGMGGPTPPPPHSKPVPIGQKYVAVDSDNSHMSFSLNFSLENSAKSMWFEFVKRNQVV